MLFETESTNSQIFGEKPSWSKKKKKPVCSPMFTKAKMKKKERLMETSLKLYVTETTVRKFQQPKQYRKKN